MLNLNFRIAQSQDTSLLVSLINSAYRQEQGNSWTSESEIVTGDRINDQQLQHSLIQDNFQLLVVELDETIVACIGLTFDQNGVEIGTFCIAPSLQNQGLGKRVLDFTEQYIIKEFPQIKTLIMWVLSVRYELIAYYERRGYVQTGKIEDYPLDADVGKPVVDLHLVEMRKTIV